MQLNLTEGKVVSRLVRFAAPLMAGNLLQQLYNVADTFIVGKYLGDEALAAVGSSYTLMVFLTSILIGLCMGSGVYLSIQFGKKDRDAFQEGCFVSFLLIAVITLMMNAAAYLSIDLIMVLMNISPEVCGMMREYLWGIFAGLFAAFLYNYLSNCLRAVGNSVVALFCAVVSSLVFALADRLMGLFVKDGSREVIAVGAEYLRIEGAFYFLIGLLFLFYGYFRAVGRPAVSVALTVVSLGTRVGLAYLFSGLPFLGVRGIWMSIPIGWLLADAMGAVFLLRAGRASSGSNPVRA